MDEGGSSRRITPSIASEEGPLGSSSPTSEARQASRSATAQSPLSTQEELFVSMPGRRQQLLEILRAIGPLGSPMLPLLLYGSASTGKTRAILQIFRHLGRPLAYVSCRSCHSPRTLFNSVLDQLFLSSASKRCDRASEFVDLLRIAVGKNSSGGEQKWKKRGNGNVVYLVFDNVELIRNWKAKGSGLLPLLFKIHDMINAPSLGLIFISSATPEAFYGDFGSMEPSPVFFPDYTEEELSRILLRNRENPDLYCSFLKVVLPSFVRISRRIDEISVALEPLYRKYCGGLPDLSVVPEEATKRKLFVSVQPHIKRALNESFNVSSGAPVDIDSDRCISRKGITGQLVSREGSSGLDFHMSVIAKYLLISAFLASRNPASLDGLKFDTLGGSSNPKRRRKISEASLQDKDNKAQDQLIKGPGIFSLERLFAIFQCITSSAEDITLEDENMARYGTVAEECGLLSQVSLQLSTLCNTNFISKGEICPLEGSIRYRSTIDEDLALKVSRSINFPLPKYIYRS